MAESDGAEIKKDTKVAETEQHNIPIICDKPGYVKYEDLCVSDIVSPFFLVSFEKKKRHVVSEKKNAHPKFGVR